ncbi:MAG: penicillin acylase family protein [Acetobacteraceae bacterium]|nr:penicillin acylase family protein [Acetobacteraceae bacterium]MBV8524795.1 penicillin acylase family protein [Acetobacteraceae bacterium]MBV8589679.1 penicillin acylase family protein [Acetobacteraceae bacterium]
MVRPYLPILALSLLMHIRAFFPKRQKFQRRLAVFPAKNLPLQRPVSVRWNEYAVPYIEAETDHDCAFALGLVHAHLREGQLALAKRLVYGRLSEIAGPYAWDLDHTIRLINFPQVADGVWERMPEETRAWVQAFLGGLNWYQDHVRSAPPENPLLGIRREQWSVADLIAIGRLAGADINWFTFFDLSRRRGDPDWPETWRRAIAAGDSAVTSFRAGPVDAALMDALLARSGPGSNCCVIGPSRAAKGAALLASDAHLPQLLPNLWLLAGVRCPSMHVVGLMPAGLPIFGLGRNSHLAWGGTNMRAASSQLYNVKALPIESRTETLRTRAWRRCSVTLRSSALGPIISDSKFFSSQAHEVVALRWAGHEASDEITAFLNVARSTCAAEFRAAFATYGVGGQNIQVATKDGHIGQVMAVWLPKRAARESSDLVLDPEDPAACWQGFRNATELPWALDPAEGFIASANNPPANTDISIDCFRINPERAQRLQSLLATSSKLTLDDVRSVQHDVVSSASAALKAKILQTINDCGLAAEQPEFIASLQAWNHSYDSSSAGPVAFETLVCHLFQRLERAAARHRLPRPRSDWNYVTTYLCEDLAALPLAERTGLILGALRAAARDAARYPGWGDMHVLRLQSPLARIPLVSRRFRIAEYGVGGSRETLMKMAHGLVRKRHSVTYGSQARFLADMADPDDSFFVLLGGQDGWLGSDNYADQVPLWRARQEIRMPLTSSRIAHEFPHLVSLQPASSTM